MVVVMSSLKSLDGNLSPAVVEAQALLYGMQLASESRLLPAVVESDSGSVINLLLSGYSVQLEIGLVLDDILSLRDSFDFIDVVFSSRSTNKVAHSLAKMALSHGLDLVLIEEVSPGLSKLI
ncbi:hypothetical protein ACOSP7_017017 [Xanthoceras sorbifolium]